MSEGVDMDYGKNLALKDRKLCWVCGAEPGATWFLNGDKIKWGIHCSRNFCANRTSYLSPESWDESYEQSKEFWKREHDRLRSKIFEEKTFNHNIDDPVDWYSEHYNMALKEIERQRTLIDEAIQMIELIVLYPEANLIREDGCKWLAKAREVLGE